MNNNKRKSLDDESKENQDPTTPNQKKSKLDLFDEKTLMSGSWDKTIKFWDISSGELIQSLNVNISIGALVMLNKSKIIKIREMQTSSGVFKSNFD